jgi:hypothetical protein
VGVPPTRSVVLLNGTTDEADGPEAHSTNGPAKPVQRIIHTSPESRPGPYRMGSSNRHHPPR